MDSVETTATPSGTVPVSRLSLRSKELEKGDTTTSTRTQQQRLHRRADTHKPTPAVTTYVRDNAGFSNAGMDDPREFPPRLSVDKKLKADRLGGREPTRF